jgi:hypothetical protein
VSQVTNKFLANMATDTIKGNVTGGSANPQDLTGLQVNTILPVFTSSLNGLVPASGGGTTNFLRADGTWAAIPSGVLQQDVYVAKNGNDTTGNGSIAAPYLTAYAAMNSFTDNSASKYYVIHMAPGAYNEVSGFYVKPFVCILADGLSPNATTLETNGGAVTVDLRNAANNASGVTGDNSRNTFAYIDLIAGLNVNRTSYDTVNTTTQVQLLNCTVGAAVAYSGYGSSSDGLYYNNNTTVSSTTAIHGAALNVQGKTSVNGIITVDETGATVGTPASSAYIFGSYVSAAIDLYGAHSSLTAIGSQIGNLNSNVTNTAGSITLRASRMTGVLTTTSGGTLSGGINLDVISVPGTITNGAGATITYASDAINLAYPSVGSIIYGSAINNGPGTALPIGTTGQVLTVASGVPSWASAPTLSSLGIRAGQQAIGSSVTSQAVTFSTSLGTTSYAVTATIANLTDTNPQMQPITITAQSATGFTASWSDPTLTANYVLNWNATLNS